MCGVFSDLTSIQQTRKQDTTIFIFNISMETWLECLLQDLPIKTVIGP